MASNFNTAPIRAAMKRLGSISNKEKKTLVRETARGFLAGKSRGGARYGIIAISPPASKGSAGSDAKKAGEKVIAADISRIFVQQSNAQLAAFEAFTGGEQVEKFGHQGAKPLGVVRAKVLRSLEELLAWHRRRRVKSTGRVMNVNRDVTTGLRKRDLAGLDVGLVTPALFQQLKKRLWERIGMLGAGWNESAAFLGVKVPAWIKRHGTTYGSHRAIDQRGRFTLELSNEVVYVAGVKDYERRVALTVQYQANAMNRQADFLMKQAIKDAGL